MSLNDISLTAGMRTNLLSLQSTTSLLNRTQERLSSGKKVNTALDNPTNFFAAQAHTQRAADLTVRKDGMTEAVQGVQAANKGITAISALIEAAKGLTQAARSAATSDRDTLGQQYNVILTQITQMAGDSGYKGKNFLGSGVLNVLFNENGGSSLTISGFDATATGMGLNTVTVASTATATGTSSLTGTSTLVTVVHTATLSTSLAAGVIAAGTATQAATGGWATGTGGVTQLLAGQITGSLSIEVSGITALMGGVTKATGVYYTGAIVINAVIVDGVRFGSDGSITGTSGTAYSGLSTFTQTIASGLVANFNSQLSGKDPLNASQTLSGLPGTATVGITGAINLTGAIFNTITGAANGTTGFDFSTALSIRFEFAFAAVTASGGVPTANNLVYDLATGDLATGITILSGYVTGTNGEDGATKIAGLVSIDGSWSTTTGFIISGNNKIYFNTGAAPTLGKVTYYYNSGFTAGGTTGVKAAQLHTLTGQTLTTGQEITAVKVAGTTLTTGYTVTGNVITLTSGLAAGSALTYVVTTTVAGGWSGDSGIDDSVNELNDAIANLRAKSSTMASNLSVVTIRQDFTDGMVTTLLKGADNLTLADMNEEGANMLMLQTRQQLGTTSLKMASDAAQSVLRLF